MDIIYKAKFIDAKTIQVTLSKQDVRKVEHLYFYVFNDNVLEEVVTSNKQSLKDDKVIFEINIKNPTNKQSGYKILLSRNVIADVQSIENIHQEEDVDIRNDEKYQEVKKFFEGKEIRISLIQRQFGFGFNRASKMYNAILKDNQKENK